MKKVFLAVLLFVVLFMTGCATEPMEPVEYAKAVMDNAQKHFDIMDEISDAVNEDLERSEFNTIRKESESILGAIEKLTPPDNYAELHEKLCRGIDKEREWFALVEKIYYTDSDNDEKLMQELNKLISEPVFPQTVLEIAKAVDDDTDGAFLETLR